MKNLTDQQFYSGQVESYTKQLDKASKKVFFLGTLRLVVFLVLLMSWFFLFGTQSIWWISLVSLISFLFLVHLSADARYQKKKAEKLVQINEKELRALDEYAPISIEEIHTFKTVQEDEDKPANVSAMSVGVFNSQAFLKRYQLNSPILLGF